MIEETCVDAYGEEEQVTGFFTMLEDHLADHLALPFRTVMLGGAVEVYVLEMTGSSPFVGAVNRVCAPLDDLPIPSPEPEGAAWIAAHRVCACA